MTVMEAVDPALRQWLTQTGQRSHVMIAAVVKHTNLHDGVNVGAGEESADCQTVLPEGTALTFGRQGQQRFIRGLMAGPRIIP